MKKCPQCGREYDNTMMFCLDDGTELLYGPASMDEPATVILSEPPALAGGISFDEEKTKVFDDSSGAKKPPESGPQNNSIAVLPFANMSADADNEYFCDGLAEDLLNALAKIEDLKVAARTSAFSFKGKNTNVSEIGTALNVNSILEGSVRQSGDRLRITVQLINAADGYHLWSEQYNRTMADIFDVQDEITLAVVDALKLKLFGAQRLLKKYTENTEAYQIYLKGRFYWNKMTAEGVRKSIEFFEQAVAIDPNYLLAYVGLSDSYLFLGIPDAMAATLSPQESLPKARAAAEKALEIDDSHAETYTSLAHAKSKEYDWAGAERDYKRSLELNPNYPLSHGFYSIFLSTMGRHDEAMKEGERALDIDPLLLPVNAGMGYVFYLARRYDEAIAQLEKTLEMEPAFPLAHRWRGLALMQKGMYREAIAAFQRSADYSNNSPLAIMSLAHAHAAAGNVNKARKALAELKDLSERQYVSAYSIALIYVGLNEKEQALQWLDKAYAEQNFELVLIKVDPRVEPLRDDRRFQELLRNVGFPNSPNARTIFYETMP